MILKVFVFFAILMRAIFVGGLLGLFGALAGRANNTAAAVLGTILFALGAFGSVLADMGQYGSLLRTRKEPGHDA